MSEDLEELHTIVRQLRAELDWAARTGGVIDTPSTVAPKLPILREEAAMPATSTTEYGTAIQALLEPCATLDDVRDVIGDCTRCKLHALGRSKIVFGVGDPRAEIMFVGEAPGQDEDRQGEPFVGKAGQLLTRIIEGGMGMKRSEVYIANVVKCRPPNNRDPEPDEVEKCEPFLVAQIRLIAPKVIIALGRHACQTLLRTTTPISKLRGRWASYAGIPVMPTFHPAYLLRNPAEKRAVWSDIQLVLERLGRPMPAKEKAE